MVRRDDDGWRHHGMVLPILHLAPPTQPNQLALPSPLLKHALKTPKPPSALLHNNTQNNKHTETIQLKSP